MTNADKYFQKRMKDPAFAAWWLYYQATLPVFEVPAGLKGEIKRRFTKTTNSFTGPVVEANINTWLRLGK